MAKQSPRRKHPRSGCKAHRGERRSASNDSNLILAVALAGQHIAYLFEDYAAAGRLARVLTRWRPVFPGYFIHYPSRRQMTPALAALVSAPRVKPGG